MSLDEDDRRLLERGSQEVVGLDGIEDDLESTTAYVGYEPSGRLHLGHMLTAQKIKDLEELGIDTKVLLADEHAFLNGKPSGVPDEEARDVITQVADMYEVALDSFGLDADIVRGSDFQFNNRDYSMVVNDIQRRVPENRLDAAVADVAGKDEDKLRYGGQLLYPAMQAADIYHLGVDIAVGGIDQRAIHMLARDFQPLGATEEDKPAAIHTPIIGKNLGEGEKMSSSGKSIPVYSIREEIEDGVNSMYLSPVVDQVRDEFEIPDSDPRSDQELLYTASPILQLIDHYSFIRGEKFEIARPKKYGGDITYESRVELIEDIGFDDDDVHPSDVKNGLTDLLYEKFKGPRKAVLDSGLHEPVEELYEN